jgi:hypothetical protein
MVAWRAPDCNVRSGLPPSLHPAAGVLAAALLDRRTMTGDEVGVLLSAVTTPRALWVA